MKNALIDENERILINQIEEKFKIGVGFAKMCEGVISEYIAVQG